MRRSNLFSPPAVTAVTFGVYAATSLVYGCTFDVVMTSHTDPATACQHKSGRSIVWLLAFPGGRLMLETLEYLAG